MDSASTDTPAVSRESDANDGKAPTDREWHEWRSHGIGGSDIGAILGLSKFASPWTVWADKQGLLPPTPETQRQRIGKRMESLLAAEFHDAHPELMVVGEQMWLTHRDWPVARCTVDGGIIETPDTAMGRARPDLEDLVGVWEAKTQGTFGWPDGIPAYIEAQCRWNMGIARVGVCYLTVMFAGFRIEHYEIAHDEDEWQFMLDRARNFWLLVEAGTAPDVDGSDATTRALRHVHPEHITGERAEIDHLADLVVERGDLKDAVKADTARLDEIDNELRAAIGDAEYATVGGVEMFTLRTQQGRKSTCPECGHTTQGAPFRVLRPTPRKKAA